VRQDYSNHRRLVPIYHYVLATLLLAVLIGSIVNLVGSLGTENLYSASLILALSVALLILGLLARAFPLKAQDRAIRAEENLRHFVLTGKPIDPRITMRQVIGLRFAGDSEFVALAARAIADSMSEDDIKKAIQNWRADDERL
jgi:hypothetical protein